MSYEPIQNTNPDGYPEVIGFKPKKKQTTLFNFKEFLQKIEEIPPVANNQIIKIVFYNGKILRMYPLHGRSWCKRKDLNSLDPNCKISRQQFGNLQDEYVKEYNSYWLEEGIDKDFIHMDRIEFNKLFSIVKKIDDVKNAPPLVLLSVPGILKSVSRSSKMKVILYGLILKFTEYQLLKYEIEKFWDKLQKTESPAELYYFCAAARQLNIDKLEPQIRIGKYRGDLVIDDRFLIMIKSRRWHIDLGKEKIYEDTKREREIQEEGYIIIPFWAYEIFQDVENCVNETIQIINKYRKYFRLKQKRGL